MSSAFVAVYDVPDKFPVLAQMHTPDSNTHMSLAALVGRLGSAPLAAVGLSGALFNFCNFLFSFLMVVTTPRVAAAVAQKDFEQVRPACDHNQLYLSVLGTRQLFP